MRAAHTTLLVVEHDLEAVTAADRWLVLAEGRVVIEGTPTHVLSHPRELAALGVRPPDLATVCERLELPLWPLDVDRVAERIRARGLRAKRREAASRRRAMPAVLEARGLRFRYEDQERDALGGIDLVVREGEMVALIGANGSGKSTLARLLGGILQGGEGCIEWRGKPLSALGARERAAAVGYVFQNPDDQIFAATVGEEIAFGPRQLGCDGAETEARVRAVVDAVGLGGLEGRDPFLLTKGERQKVAVASILALRPTVLILDEPTTGLDFRELVALLNVLGRLHRAGQTVVMITHVPWVVGTYAERAVLLEQGRILYDGPVESLFADEALCRSADFVPPEAARLANRLGTAAVDVEGLLALVS